VVLVKTDVSEEHITTVFRVRDFESPWFAVGMFLTTEREESLLQRCLPEDGDDMFPETSILSRIAQHRHIPEDSILQDIICPSWISKFITTTKPEALSNILSK
jgi:hypothetical protein